MARKVGLNIISTGRWCVGEMGLKNAALLAHEAGFDGLHILPLKSWGGKTFRDLSYTVKEGFIISYQWAWNCGHLLGAVGRHLHILKDNHPTFKDWYLFGTRQKTEKIARMIEEKYGGSSTFISTWPSFVGTFEMNPEAKIPVPIYADFKNGLVWDTKHVLRPGRHGEPPIATDWRCLLDEVAHNIRFIHVKTDANPEMLRALAKKTNENCPVILEDRPPLDLLLWPCIESSRKFILNWLREKRIYLSQFFD